MRARDKKTTRLLRLTSHLLSRSDGVESGQILLRHHWSSLVLALGRHSTKQLPALGRTEVNDQSGGDESPLPSDTGELEDWREREREESQRREGASSGTTRRVGK